MTTLAAHPTRSIYGAFAATRLALSRSQLEISGHYDPTMRFWFARFELYIALLILMDNWYAASAGGGSGATRLSNLISQMPCSYTKARQAIAEAIAQGFVRLVASEADHRLKVVKPTERTIGVWEAYFDEALAIMEDTGLIELLIERREALKAGARRASRQIPSRFTANSVTDSAADNTVVAARPAPRVIASRVPPGNSGATQGGRHGRKRSPRLPRRT